MEGPLIMRGHLAIAAIAVPEPSAPQARRVQATLALVIALDTQPVPE